MQMTRRGLLGMFAATAVLDPERALWVLGTKTISIAKPRVAQRIVSRYLLDGQTYNAGFSVRVNLADDLRIFGDVSRRMAIAHQRSVEEFVSRELFQCK